MKQIVYRCLHWLLALGLTAGTVGCDNREPLRIGFIAGLSGRVADLGVSGRNGALLAVEQINQAGGIHGRRIEVIVRDDRQDVETAKNAVSELLDMNLEVIIGPMTSSMAMATIALVNATPTVMVSPTVTTTDLAGRDDQFLRVIATTTAYAAKSARYQYATLRHRTAVAIYDMNNQAYTESWLRDFRRTYESLGGRILKIHRFMSGDDAAFFKATQDLLATRPEVVVIISNAVDAALICQQVRKLDPDKAIVISEWGSTERFIELGGAATEGVHVAQFLNRNDNSDRFQTFRKAYLERFGQEPGFAGAAGYDAASVVLEAFTVRKKDQTLKQTIIEKGRFQGIQQTIAIDRFGDADRTTHLTIVKNGKYQIIESDE